jgi:hypothetical protein
MMDVTVHGVKELSLSIRENNSTDGGRVHMNITDSWGNKSEIWIFSHDLELLKRAFNEIESSD